MSDLSVNIDFIVLNTLDPRVIIVADKSQWGVANNRPSIISITPPGSKQAITKPFAKRKLNFFNATNLGLDCFPTDCSEHEAVFLPDGIWEFCLESDFEGLKKRRFFLKDDSIRIELDKLYIKQGLRFDPLSNIFQSTSKIEFYLTSANAFVRDGDHVLAHQAFVMAQKELEKWKDCKDCI